MRQNELDKKKQVETKSMSQQQLKGLLSSLKVDERQTRKGHWVDVFHEEDGEATGQGRQSTVKIEEMRGHDLQRSPR